MFDGAMPSRRVPDGVSLVSDASPQPAVRLSAVAKRFGDIVAVHPLDLEIPTGGFFSIIGPSGCGKTTTLRMIAGLEHPDAGTIEVGGRAPRSHAGSPR